MTVTTEPPTTEPPTAEAAARAGTAPPAAPTGAVEPGLDRPVRLIGGRLWLGVVALLLAVGAGAGWGAAGSLPHTLSVPGVLAHGPAPVVARAARPGSVLSVLVAPGAQVVQGQPVAVLGTGAVAAPSTVTAPETGTVTDVLAAPGSVVAAGAGVVAVDPSAAPDTVRLFVGSAAEFAELRLGQKLLIQYQNGRAELRITSLDPYPASAATLDGTLPVPVPGLPSGSAPVWTVYAALDLPPGAADPAATGPVLVAASVDLGARHPYQVLFDIPGAGR